MKCQILEYSNLLIPAGTSPEGDASKEERDERVKTYFDANPMSSVRQAARILNLSYGCVWRILRNTLHWKAYKPQLTNVLNQASRV